MWLRSEVHYQTLVEPPLDPLMHDMAASLWFHRFFLVFTSASVGFFLLALFWEGLSISLPHTESILKTRSYDKGNDNLNTHDGILVDAQTHGLHSHIPIRSLNRREDYTCAPGRRCTNGACCGASGNCGYGKPNQPFLSV